MMYLVHTDGPVNVRVGYDPELDAFRCRVDVGQDGLYPGGCHRAHDGQYSRAVDALNAAQHYVGWRLSSVWLWRMVNDRDNTYRPKRVVTRSHNLEPGRYAA